jgi:hypothetical protein
LEKLEDRLAELFAPFEMAILSTDEDYRKALDSITDGESMDHAMKLAHQILTTWSN